MLENTLVLELGTQCEHSQKESAGVIPCTRGSVVEYIIVQAPCGGDEDDHDLACYLDPISYWRVAHVAVQRELGLRSKRWTQLDPLGLGRSSRDWTDIGFSQRVRERVRDGADL